MKYLGLDYGTKRIGVAVCDEGAMVAFPLGVVAAGPRALTDVLNIAKENSVGGVVLGESRDLKGEKNTLMEDIEQFKKDLEEVSQLPVHYEPEFFTSALAARQGRDKRGAGEGKADLDASAAALILQSFLDRMRNHGDHQH